MTGWDAGVLLPEGSPWQRLSNENTNGCCASNSPKGSDRNLRAHDAAEIAAVAADRTNEATGHHRQRDRGHDPTERTQPFDGSIMYHLDQLPAEFQHLQEAQRQRVLDREARLRGNAS